MIAVAATPTAETGCAISRADNSPKFLFPLVNLDPHPIHGSLSPTESATPPPKWHLNWFRQVCRAHPCNEHKVIQTTLCAISVAVGVVYAMHMKWSNVPPPHSFTSSSRTAFTDFARVVSFELLGFLVSAYFFR